MSLLGAAMQRVRMADRATVRADVVAVAHELRQLVQAGEVDGGEAMSALVRAAGEAGCQLGPRGDDPGATAAIRDALGIRDWIAARAAETAAQPDEENAATVLDPGLSAGEARARTDEVKADARALWRKLLALYEGRAHHALRYPSWGAYCAAEFDLGQSHAYRLLDSGRVVAAIEAHSPNGERPASEGVARVLAPVLRADGPEAAAQAWEAAVEEHGPAPTAAQVRERAAAVRDAPAPVAPPTAADEPSQRFSVIAADLTVHPGSAGRLRRAGVPAADHAVLVLAVAAPDAAAGIRLAGQLGFTVQTVAASRGRTPAPGSWAVAPDLFVVATRGEIPPPAQPAPACSDARELAAKLGVDGPRLDPLASRDIDGWSAPR